MLSVASKLAKALTFALSETRTKSHSTIEPALLGIEPNQTNRPEPDTEIEDMFEMHRL